MSPPFDDETSKVKFHGKQRGSRMKENGQGRALKQSGLSCRHLCSTEQGPIVEILVEGGLSFPNTDHEQANVLFRFVRECLSELSPAGVLFDMTEFKYQHGNSIGAVFLQVKSDRSGFIPIGIVAKGRTRRGLTSLLDFIGGVNNLPYLVTNRRLDALEFLQDEGRHERIGNSAEAPLKEQGRGKLPQE